MNNVQHALAYQSVKVGNYLKLVEFMKLRQFGFKDVQILCQTKAQFCWLALLNHIASPAGYLVGLFLLMKYSEIA